MPHKIRRRSRFLGRQFPSGFGGGSFSPLLGNSNTGFGSLLGDFPTLLNRNGMPVGLDAPFFRQGNDFVGEGFINEPGPDFSRLAIASPGHARNTPFPTRGSNNPRNLQRARAGLPPIEDTNPVDALPSATAGAPATHFPTKPRGVSSFNTAMQILQQGLPFAPGAKLQAALRELIPLGQRGASPDYLTSGLLGVFDDLSAQGFNIGTAPTTTGVNAALRTVGADPESPQFLAAAQNANLEPADFQQVFADKLAAANIPRNALIELFQLLGVPFRNVSGFFPQQP